MTNKLPVVGKRYRDIASNDKYLCVSIFGEYKNFVVLNRDENKRTPWTKELVYLPDFFEFFEELPEDRAETKQSQRCECGYKISTGGMFLGSCNSTPCSRKLNTEPRNAKIVGFDDSSKGGEPFYITKDDLSPEVKKAIEFLRLETNLFEKVGEVLDERLINTLKLHHKHLAIASKNLLNALDEQFAYVLKPRKKDALDDKIEESNKKIKAKPLKAQDLKVNETSESVDVKEKEVKEKEEEFFYAAAGRLIEYQGKKYVALQQTNYLPNERPEDWLEGDYSSRWSRHTKIKFRDVFANNKIQAKEVVDNKIEPNENGSFKHLDNAEEISQDIIKKSAEESIWKPVSELPEELYEEVLIKTDLDNIRRGYFYNVCGKFEVMSGYSVETKKYCTLTDFINDYEKLKERVKKLEGK